MHDLRIIIPRQAYKWNDPYALVFTKHEKMRPCRNDRKPLRVCNNLTKTLQSLHSLVGKWMVKQHFHRRRWLARSILRALIIISCCKIHGKHKFERRQRLASASLGAILAAPVNVPRYSRGMYYAIWRLRSVHDGTWCHMLVPSVAFIVGCVSISLHATTRNIPNWKKQSKSHIPLTKCKGLSRTTYRHRSISTITTIQIQRMKPTTKYYKDTTQRYK